MKKGRGYEVREQWVIIGDIPPRLWKGIAEFLALDSNTLFRLNQVADRVPTARGLVKTAPYLAHLPADVAMPAPVTVKALKAWVAGTEPIPQWVAQALLHHFLVGFSPEAEEGEEWEEDEPGAEP